MAKRGEIGSDGLMPSERRQQAQRGRAVGKQQARQAVRNAEPNPACRVYREDRVISDRPEDIAFNIACRKFEIEQWQ